jgi:hypothetical protein
MTATLVLGVVILTILSSAVAYGLAYWTASVAVRLVRRLTDRLHRQHVR